MLKHFITINLGWYTLHPKCCRTHFTDINFNELEKAELIRTQTLSGIGLYHDLLLQF